MTKPVDLLAIVAHRDDAELTCGGTLARAHQQGYRTGILDLTAGETGTRGTAQIRAEEAQAAAKVLGVSERVNAQLPDAGIHNTDETRRIVVEMIRTLRPSTVILPFPVGRHPDHRMVSELGRDACFLSGLAKYSADGTAFRPNKVVFAQAFRESPPKPSFVVDITEVFEAKMQAIQCYTSQFEGAVKAGELFPTGIGLYELVRTQCAHYGSLIRSGYGEPFHTEETVRVDDVVAMGVETF